MITLYNSNMKSIYISLLAILLTTGCSDSSSQKKVSLMGDYGNGVNKNSIAYKSNENQKDRDANVELSQIDSTTKIEIAKIESNNKLLIAKVNADAKKDVAHVDSTTKIETTKIDSLTKKEDIQSNLYITITLILIVGFAFVLLYFNNKKNRELKNKLHQDNLKHEQLLKEREFDEKRLHKMLDLVGEGKLSSDMAEEIITSITKPKQNLIESK